MWLSLVNTELLISCMGAGEGNDQCGKMVPDCPCGHARIPQHPKADTITIVVMAAGFDDLYRMHGST